MASKMAFFKYFSCFGVKMKKARDTGAGAPSPSCHLEDSPRVHGRTLVRFIVDVELHKVERFDFSTKEVKSTILFTRRNNLTEVQLPESDSFIDEGDLTLEEL